jgi:transcriptional regulator with XRE-family HTH domain
MTKNLNTKITKTATRWKERAKQDRKNRSHISRSQAFALELLDYMEANNIKQKDLAEKMNVTPQQVHKILQANANLTFDTLDKIAAALEITISSPKIISAVSLKFQTLDTMQIVHRHKQKVVDEDASFPARVEKNPILITTVASMNDYKYTADKI